ncbi:16S rRNA (cytosine(967)-C(5))-methyltransferase RsmB [soil metagenome]
MIPPTAARAAAFEILLRCFEHDAWADRAVPAAAERHGLKGRERGQAQRLAYGSVQMKGTSDALVERLGSKRVAKLDPPVIAALRLGIYEILFADATPDHAAVGEAVELAKVGMRRDPRRAKAAAGMVNAILRRVSRERAELLESFDDSTAEGASLAHSMPRWISDMWFEQLGAEPAGSLMAALNRAPETALRASTMRVDPAELAAELTEAGEAVRWHQQGTTLWPAGALVIDGPLGELSLRKLAEGAMIAQSRAAQAVVALLAAEPGQRVLDLCAGPGVKTSGLAASMRGEGELVAVERDEARAREVVELCERSGAPAPRIVVGDAGDPAGADLGSGYDRVLVDPPCSDLGTLASRPDARWRKSPETIARLSEVQAQILDRAATALAPGGLMVYSTCTISNAENEARMAELLESRPELRADDLGGGEPELAAPGDPRFLQTRPDRDGTDGFFIARLRKAR